MFRIDLSRVVSKYIGETEKNLARLFDRAEHKNWILFFDEADALFGKRTEIRDAHDKYANQEVAYLLQRIENYAGLVILASNQRGNLDEAFLRRFQAVIHFPVPMAEDRRDLWQRAFPSQIQVADDVDWRDIASRFELTGAGIVNVAHFCAIEALANTTPAGGPRIPRSRRSSASWSRKERWCEHSTPCCCAVTACQSPNGLERIEVSPAEFLEFHPGDHPRIGLVVGVRKTTATKPSRMPRLA